MGSLFNYLSTRQANIFSVCQILAKPELTTVDDPNVCRLPGLNALHISIYSLKKIEALGTDFVTKFFMQRIEVGSDP
jgi:hypothetical protein